MQQKTGRDHVSTRSFVLAAMIAQLALVVAIPCFAWGTTKNGEWLAANMARARTGVSRGSQAHCRIEPNRLDLLDYRSLATKTNRTAYTGVDVPAHSRKVATPVRIPLGSAHGWACKVRLRGRVPAERSLLA
jgi:hypothetical protein